MDYLTKFLTTGYKPLGDFTTLYIKRVEPILYNY